MQLVRGMSDVPTRLGDVAYVVGGDSPKWLVISCPCGCGRRIDVNLMRSLAPHWTLVQGEEGLTVHPSLWQPNTSCGSHFWIRGGRVFWV